MTVVAKVVLDKKKLAHKCVKHDMTLHFIELFQKIANVNVHIDLHMARGRRLSLIKRFIVEDIYIYIYIYIINVYVFIYEFQPCH
jgi:hypothetical protein